jgi:hypothetical protein
MTTSEPSRRQLSLDGQAISVHMPASILSETPHAIIIQCVAIIQNCHGWEHAIHFPTVVLSSSDTLDFISDQETTATTTLLPPPIAN